MPKQPLAQVPEDATWFWQAQGSCRTVDPTLFFHPQNERGLSRLRRDRQAKAVCATCAVRLECADYAIRAREPYGVWGGLTEEDREAIYRKLSSLSHPRGRHGGHPGGHPRERGQGLAAAGSAVNQAISPQALGTTV
jgi:WhiB family redox-sensing transcriptional regulator